jgi:hypothetical protein
VPQLRSDDRLQLTQQFTPYPSQRARAIGPSSFLMNRMELIDLVESDDVEAAAWIEPRLLPFKQSAGQTTRRAPAYSVE